MYIPGKTLLAVLFLVCPGYDQWSLGNLYFYILIGYKIYSQTNSSVLLIYYKVFIPNILVIHGGISLYRKQGRKRQLDTPKRMIERREKEGEREKER